ncbi:MAG: bacterial Ig-like domain-containing protein [Oscillospiraceae bacterium]|nr:bacterial Ig-like domain-containing protein [Oscillospiraceae bacterium]
MKKFIIALLCIALTAPYAVIPVSAADDKATETISYNYTYTSANGYSDEDVHTREMEKLDRGLVAVKVDSGVYLSWRLFDSEDAIYGSAENNVSFKVYRDSEEIADVENSTNYVDSQVGTSYSVAPVVDGIVGEKCKAVTVYENSYFDIPIKQPASETIITPSGETVGTFNFSPADCSTGDLDGDGEYEIVIKWISSEHDVGSPGDGIGSFSGTVRFAAYKLDGTKLWDNDINLGKNVYSSAHTVQFLVYDFDGDGKAEMMCQTSLGSKDAKDRYVSHSAKNDDYISEFTDEDNENTDYRPDWGPVHTGEEFLTVFNGETGEAIDTIDLPTARGDNDGACFGDTSGNRSNRFLASVAYLDGQKPYAVYLRGYYFGRNGRQRTSIAGISFDGNTLSPDYRFDTKSGQPGYYNGAAKYVGNGNHNCTVADVDGDGKDEFITGALCMEVDDDNQFRPRWCTFMEHGDALHIGDYDPTIEGLEFFTVHEDAGPNKMSGKEVEINFGMTVINADTGDIIFHQPSGDDNGRGIMANIGAGGYYQITSANAGTFRSNGGSSFTAGNYGMSQNFRIFWDGDLYDELLDGTSVTDWNGSGMNSIFSASRGYTKINGTKSNPGLQADLFGDWREELIYPASNGTSLRVFMTTTPTDYKVKTLMHDPVYRSGVAAEQTAYNQPPHVGFYLADEMFKPEITNMEITNEPTKKVYALGEELDTDGLEVTVTYKDETTETVNSYGISGYNPNILGDQTITVTYHGLTAFFVVTVKEVTGIIMVSPPNKTEYKQGEQLDLTGMVIEATYSDGTTVNVNNYTVSGYSPGTTGEQTITVSYADFSVTFLVTVKKADLSALNGTYSTSSTQSSNQRIELGSFADSFVIEHTFKINSMPATANRGKQNYSGFVMRFMSANKGVGSGWALIYSGNNASSADIIWKNAANNAPYITSRNAPIKAGEEYSVRYVFTEVATGNGALVDFYIYDSNGKEVVSAKNLDMRNLTSDNQKVEPVTAVEIYNQARQDAESSITIDNARIIINGLVDVNGRNVSFNVNNAEKLGTIDIYAAKYSNGKLSDVAKLDDAKAGMSSASLTFDPDKIFVWDSMKPVDLWTKPIE